MEKLTREEFDRIMWDSDKELTGVIVFKQSNFDREFTETERSYRVSNNSYYYKSGKISNALYGDCIDGVDLGVRLDWYNWETEFCYFEE